MTSEENYMLPTAPPRSGNYSPLPTILRAVATGLVFLGLLQGLSAQDSPAPPTPAIAPAVPGEPQPTTEAVAPEVRQELIDATNKTAVTNPPEEVAEPRRRRDNGGPLGQPPGGPVRLARMHAVETPPGSCGLG